MKIKKNKAEKHRHTHTDRQTDTRTRARTHTHTHTHTHLTALVYAKYMQTVINFLCCATTQLDSLTQIHANTKKSKTANTSQPRCTKHELYYIHMSF